MRPALLHCGRTLARLSAALVRLPVNKMKGASDTALSYDITNGTGGSLGLTHDANGGNDDDDVLGGKRTFYPSGQLCSYFKKDGSGIVHYEDGRIGVKHVSFSLVFAY